MAEVRREQHDRPGGIVRVAAQQCLVPDRVANDEPRLDAGTPTTRVLEQRVRGLSAMGVQPRHAAGVVARVHHVLGDLDLAELRLAGEPDGIVATRSNRPKL